MGSTWLKKVPSRERYVTRMAGMPLPVLVAVAQIHGSIPRKAVPMARASLVPASRSDRCRRDNATIRAAGTANSTISEEAQNPSPPAAPSIAQSISRSAPSSRAFWAMRSASSKRTRPSTMVTSCNPYSRVEFHSEDSDQMKLSTAATTAAAGRNSRSPMRQTSTEPRGPRAPGWR